MRERKCEIEDDGEALFGFECERTNVRERSKPNNNEASASISHLQRSGSLLTGFAVWVIYGACQWYRRCHGELFAATGCFHRI